MEQLEFCVQGPLLTPTGHPMTKVLVAINLSDVESGLQKWNSVNYCELLRSFSILYFFPFLLLVVSFTSDSLLTFGTRNFPGGFVR